MRLKVEEGMKRAVAMAMAALMLVPPAMFGQQTAAPAPRVTQLKIYVLQGKGTVHVPGSDSLEPLAVEVRDQGDYPVQGATVEFRLPASGAGGTFRDGTMSTKAMTGPEGQVLVEGFKANSSRGKFVVEVIATLGAVKTQAQIEQYIGQLGKTTETVKSSKPFYKKKLFWVAAGAAAGAVTYVLIRPKDKGVDVSTGGVVIGGR